MTGVAQVRRHKVLERFFVDVIGLFGRVGMAIVLDVQPAQTGLQLAVLLEALVRREALSRDVGPVEDQHQRGMVHLAMDLGQQTAGLTDQIGFQLQAESQVAAVARFRDLAQLIDDLRQVLPRIGPARMIEGEPADQLRLERMGHLARLLDVLLQVLLERHKTVRASVVHVQQLDLSNRRPDRRHIQAVPVLQMPDLGDLRLGQLHHVLDALPRVDEPNRVVLQAQGSEGRKLLLGQLLVGGFIGETGQNHRGFVGHGSRPSLVRWLMSQHPPTILQASATGFK